MDKPQSFEEVFKDAYDYWIDDANIHRYEGAKGLADQVWQHQQAKVEELEKRVDAVIIEIENMYLSGDIGFDAVKKLEQALKGEGCNETVDIMAGGASLSFGVKPMGGEG